MNSSEQRGQPGTFIVGFGKPAPKLENKAGSYFLWSKQFITWGVTNTCGSCNMIGSLVSVKASSHVSRSSDCTNDGAGGAIPSHPERKTASREWEGLPHTREQTHQRMRRGSSPCMESSSSSSRPGQATLLGASGMSLLCPHPRTCRLMLKISRRIRGPP